MPAQTAAPGSLRPPNGPASLSSRGAFTQTMPASSSFVARLTSTRSGVQMFEPRPKGEAFASRSASSKLSTRTRGASGPNTSPLITSMSDVTSSSTVGSKKKPSCPSGRPPSSATRAPCSTARASMASYRSRSFALAIGPTSTLSRPLPTRRRAASSRRRAANSS
jgi:hypothetical protein